MTNTLKAETRKLPTEYATASFEEVEHSSRELESKAALAEQVASLPEAFKATYSALLDETPLGMRAAEKRMAALAIAKARLTLELPVKGSPDRSLGLRPEPMTRCQLRVENRAAPAQKRELGCGRLVTCVVFQLEAEPSEYLLHRTVLPQHSRGDCMNPLVPGKTV